MKQINIYKALAAWLFSLLFLVGCTDSYSLLDGKSGDKTLVKLDLAVPGSALGTLTKAMEPADETMLKNVHVLMFKEENGVERYIQRTEFTTGLNGTLTWEVNSDKNNNNYRFVALANVSITQEPSPGTSKETVLNAIEFSCTGKWGNTPIPMWGEYSLIQLNKKEQYVNILLHRALARVDIGLKFTEPITKENQSEEVEGLDNFQLSSIRVYRTVNKGYASTTADRLNVNNETYSPNVHPEAIYNLNGGGSNGDIGEADKDPLLYDFKSKPSNSCIREIYLPESIFFSTVSGDGGVTPNMDNVPCLVIGGYYGKGNTTDETFYRVDFAKYDDNGIIIKDSYEELLRNHRYVVNIKSASGPGFKDPDHALNSINAKLELEVAKWNEVPMNYFVVGDYYFKIKSREVVLPAALFGEEGELLEEEQPEIMIPIETNIPIELSYEDLVNINEAGGAPKSFKWKWKSVEEDEYYKISTIFDPYGVAYLSDDKKNIVIKVSQNTDQGSAPNPYKERTDNLIVFVDDYFQFTIKVTQEADIRPSYTLDCGTVKLNGIYKKGNSLSSSNYVEVVVNFDESGEDATTLEGASYVIETDKLNGISFRAQGKFGPKGTSIDGHGKSYLIRLEGTGTIEDYAISNHTITCNSISTGNTTCSVKVETAYKSIRILALSENSNYGYGLNPSGYANSYNFVTSAANFGLNPNSTVKVESVSITHTTNSDYFQAQLKTNPDIILCALPASSINKVSRAELKAYLERGGVFICLHEGDFGAFIRMLPDLNGASILTGPQNASAEIYSAVNDMVTNGSFGDLRGKHWGATGTNKAVGKVTTVGRGKLTVYSEYYHRDKTLNPMLFKHNELSFFYCGDGGLLTNDSYLGYGSSPFSVNRDTGYTPMTATYGGQTVYSAALFGNIMEWAMYQATYHGINK